MKLPRDVNAQQLISALARCCYEVSRRTGSHVRLTFTEGDRHHVTIPVHNPLHIGTLAAVVTDVAQHLGISKTALVNRLFG